MTSSKFPTLKQDGFALAASGCFYVCLGSLVAHGMGVPHALWWALGGLIGTAGFIGLDYAVRRRIY